ncbi:exported protein of unknown function [Candidatus Filomicrobium marinum]|uniref:PRC-barrel domain-containing protein n=1 Tax=Candidatus Filomicrobium marinum TaxID=1608628 RepID=A0A0D6JH76_9HYPH|nr:PRC-barrel domain-containing protein [Candidatus Filomicrobium marinum]CFX51178.1 exported protein of unknown function [Candidatus Filomicrobium marinum]CPR20155.1 exported protein of unknown function [Candidatus Filomicrobium marinum]
MRGFLLTASAIVALSPAFFAAPAMTQTATDTANSSTLEFISGPSADEVRASRWIGAPVKNNADEKIGDVNDLVLSPSGQVQALVLGVGGFVGLAEKYVAVKLADTELRKEKDGSHIVIVDTTKEALQAAPEFKVAGEKTMRDRLDEASKAVKSGYETVKEKAKEGYEKAKEAMQGDGSKQPAPAEKQ